jgi:hypothetical protein
MSMTASTRFEDRLLEQLRGVVAARPVPDVVTRRRPGRTRLALAGAGVAAATAVVAIVATGGDVTPAYAVESGPGGSVTVEIRSLSDAAGLQRSLRDAGVPAVVDYAPAGCADPGAGGGPGPSTRRERDSDAGPSLSGPGPGPGATTSQARVDGDGVKFTIDPGTVKPGQKVFITTSTGAVSTIGMAIGNERPDVPCAPTGGTR